MSADHYQRALGHLTAAMEAMTSCRDTLAAAIIARALSVVERGAAMRADD